MKINIRDPFGDEVAFAFQMTTPEQRLAVAQEWTQGKEHLRNEYAKLLVLNREALLLSGLLDMEHESVCKPNGCPKKRTFEDLRKLMIAYKFVDKSPLSVDNYGVVCGENVDNLCKSEIVPVDKMWIDRQLSTAFRNPVESCG